MLAEVKQRIPAAQYEALRAVNQQLIGLYWDSGRLIVERQRGDTWGRSLVEQIAHDLQAEFPGLAGFSARNLWRMRDFYQSYSAAGKLPPMVAEIGWTHIVSTLPSDLQGQLPAPEQGAKLLEDVER